MLAFPTNADSVGGWLDAINMSRYKQAFENAGITQVNQLFTLSDEQVQAAGVALVGHRKRLLQATKELVPAPQAMEAEAAFAHAPPMPKHTPSTQAATPSEPEAMDVGGSETQTQQRFNSTSSIFITSTISKPDIDEIIFCVAVVIHDRIVQGEQAGYDARSRFPFFSEDNNPLYADPAEQNGVQMGGRERQEQPGVADGDPKKKPRREVPAEETIYYTIRSVYDCARFPSECLIVSLVYMERLIAFSQVPILVTSWRPILLAALILAQKVWDDRSLHNVDFSTFCPMFTLKEINHLEMKFLELIDYDVSISSSLYASYYFQLRTLCQRENRSFSLAPISVENAAKLEARGLAYQAKFSKQAGRTWQSANNIDLPSIANAGLNRERGSQGGASGASAQGERNQFFRGLT